MLKLKKRAREISFKSSSLSGQISSKKLNKSVQFESSLEKDYIYLLEFDKSVGRYLEQPLVINYKDSSGINRKYTPDFIVNYKDKFKKDELIEIKYQVELESKKEELAEKFEAARKFCIENDIVFRVISDIEIRDENHVYLKNIKFLSWYKDFFANINYEATNLSFDTSYSHILLDNLEDRKNCTINELIYSVTSDKDKIAELIFLTWYLIANNFINCNLNLLLNLESKIWTN